MGYYIIPKNHARLLRTMSILAVLTGITGIINGKPVLGALTCIGSFFAQNHWKDPKYGWARTLDMAWVQLVIWSHAYYIFNTPHMYSYYGIQSLGVLSYFISWYYQNRKNMIMATFYHGSLHVCANASLLLYCYL